MKKEKKYSITVQQFDEKERRYVGTLVILSVSEATKLYNDAKEAGDQAQMDKYCAYLNAIREKAGKSVPVC